VCGSQVTSSLNPNPPSTSTPVSPDIQQRASELITQDLFAKLSELTHYYNKLAKNGPLTENDVKEATDFYDTAWEFKPDVSNPLCELIIWFPIAQTTCVFFNQRWLSPTVSRTDKAHRNLISADWLTYCNKPFTELLTKNPDLTPEVAQSFCSHFPALKRWLEDKMLKDLMVARFAANMKPDKNELDGIIYLLGSERANAVLRYASSVAPSLK